MVTHNLRVNHPNYVTSLLVISLVNLLQNKAIKVTETGRLPLVNNVVRTVERVLDEDPEYMVSSKLTHMVLQ